MANQSVIMLYERSFMGITSLRLIKDSYLNYKLTSSRVASTVPHLFLKDQEKKILDSKRRDDLYDRTIDLANLASSITSKHIVAHDNYTIQGCQSKELLITQLSKKFEIQEYSIKIILSQVVGKKISDIIKMFELNENDVALERNGKKQFTEIAVEKIICETIAVYQDLLKIKTDPTVSNQYLQYLLFGEISGRVSVMEFFYGKESPFQSKALPELLSISGIHRNHHSDFTFFNATQFFSRIFRKGDYRFAFTDKAQKILSNIFFPERENQFKVELENILLEGYFNKVTNKPISNINELFQIKYEDIQFLVKPGKTDRQVEEEQANRTDLILKFKSYLEGGNEQNSFFGYDLRNKVSKSFILRNRIESPNFSKHEFAGLFHQPSLVRQASFEQSISKFRRLIVNEANQLRHENQILNDLTSEVLAASAFEKMIEEQLVNLSCDNLAPSDIAKKICKKNKQIADFEALLTNIVIFYMQKKQNQGKITDIISQNEKDLQKCLDLFERLENLGSSSQIDENKEKCQQHLRDIQNLKEKIQNDFGTKSDEIRESLKKHEEKLNEIYTKLDLFLQIKLDELNPLRSFNGFFEDQISSTKMEDNSKIFKISEKYEKLIVQFKNLVSNIEKRTNSNENISHILSDLKEIEIDVSTDFGKTLASFIGNLRDYVKQKFYLFKAQEYVSIYLKSEKDYHREYTLLASKILQKEIEKSPNSNFIFLPQYESLIAPQMKELVLTFIQVAKKNPERFKIFMDQCGLTDQYVDCIALVKKYVGETTFLEIYKQQYKTDELILTHDEKLYLETLIANVLSIESNLLENDMAFLSEFIARMLQVSDVKKFIEKNEIQFRSIVQNIKSHGHVFHEKHDQILRILSENVNLDADLISDCTDLSISTAEYQSLKNEFDDLKLHFLDHRICYEISEENETIIRNKIFKVYIESFIDGKDPLVQIEKKLLKRMKKQDARDQLLKEISELKNRLERCVEKFKSVEHDLKENLQKKKIQVESRQVFSTYWGLISKIKLSLNSQKSLNAKMKILDQEIEFSFVETKNISECLASVSYFKNIELEIQNESACSEIMFVDLDAVKEENKKLLLLLENLDLSIRQAQGKVFDILDVKKTHLLKTVEILNDHNIPNRSEVIKTVDQLKGLIKETDQMNDFFGSLFDRSMDSLSDQEMEQIENYYCNFIFFDLLLSCSKKSFFDKISIEHVLLNKSNRLYENVLQKVQDYNKWIETLGKYSQIKEAIQSLCDEYEKVVLVLEEIDVSDTKDSFSKRFFSFFTNWIDCDFSVFSQDYSGVVKKKQQRLDDDLDWILKYEKVFLESVMANMYKFPEYTKILLSKSMTETRGFSNLIGFADAVLSTKSNSVLSSSLPRSFQTEIREVDFKAPTLDFLQGSFFAVDKLEVDMLVYEVPSFGLFGKPVPLKSTSNIPIEKNHFEFAIRNFIAQFNLLEKILNLQDKSILGKKSFLAFFYECLNHFHQILNLLGDKSAGKSFIYKMFSGYDLKSYIVDLHSGIEKFKGLSQDIFSDYPILRNLEDAIQRYKNPEEKPRIEGYLEIMTLLFANGIHDPNEIEKELLVHFYNEIIFEYNQVNPNSGFHFIQKYNQLDFIENLSSLLFSCSSEEFLMKLYLINAAKDCNKEDHLVTKRLKSDRFFFQLINQIDESGIPVDDLKKLVNRYVEFADKRIDQDLNKNLDLNELKEIVFLIKDELRLDALYFFKEFRNILFFGEKLKLFNFLIDGHLQAQPPFALIQRRHDDERESDQVSHLIIKGLHKFILEISNKDKLTVFQLFQIFENCFFNERMEFISKWDLIFTFFPFDNQNISTLNSYDLMKLMILNILLYTIIRFDLDLEKLLRQFESELNQMSFDYSNRFNVGKFKQDQQKKLDKFDVNMCFDLSVTCIEMISFLKEQNRNYHDLFLEDLKSLFVAEDSFHLLEIIYSLNMRKANILKLPFAKIRSFYEPEGSLLQSEALKDETESPSKRIVAAVAATRELLNYQFRSSKDEAFLVKPHEIVVSHFRRVS